MKTYVLTMAYGSPECFRAGMQRFRETLQDPGDLTHIILDQHYPLRHKELQEAIAEYKASAPYTVHWFDAGKNLGLHEGLNYMISHIPAEHDEALIIGLDQDENPHREGWLEAMRAVMTADPACGWLSLMHPAAQAHMEKHGFTVRTPGGVNVWTHNYALINTVCGWRLSAIRKVGKFHEPHQWYGGLEIAMMPGYRDAGYWIG